MTLAPTQVGALSVLRVTGPAIPGKWVGTDGMGNVAWLNPPPVAEVVDADVAALMADPGTATGGHLAGKVNKGDLVVNVKDYGATGDSTTDDTAAIRAACAAAEAASTGTIAARVFFPPGIYRITDTITFVTNVDGSAATLWYYGTGRAVQVGYTATTVLTDKDIHLPRVICRSAPAGTWDGTSQGVVVLSANQCRIHVPRVETFETGVLITANGSAGTAYCEFYLGSLWINRENLVLDQGSPTVGWVNQNNFYGGRITHSVNRGAPDDPGACHLRIGNHNNFPAANVPDGNAFYGLSMEGVNAGPGGWARYRVYCYGKYNQFFNCRWEARDGGVPVIRTGGLASNNIIHGGYHSWRLVQSGLPNAMDIRDGVPGRVEAVNTTGQVLASGANSVVTGWTNSTLEKVEYNDTTGEWKPRAGVWRIKARVTYAQNTTGTRTTRLYVGSTVVDQALTPAQSTNSALTAVVEATARFDGNSTFRVQAQQTSGGDLALVGASPYVNLQAEYVSY